MELKEDYFTETKESLRRYVEDRLLLLKLQATDQVSKAIASFATILLATILGTVFLVLLGITAGFFFTSLTGNPLSGFGIVTGIYLVLIVLVVIVLKKKIESSVINAVIRKLFNQEKNATDEQHHN
ncbi:MAG: phage holin family protein [Ferruginibacter sp.]